MIKRIFAMHSLCMLFGMAAYAQLASTTSLVGTVTDPSGKSVQGAKVTAVEAGTLTTYSTATNEAGYFSIDFVKVGNYNITVEQPGFQKVTKTGVQVSINQIVRTDFKMAIGAISQAVTVQAEATAIKTDDATVSENISTRAVAELPLSGRDAMQLAVLTPGVLRGPKSSDTATPPGNDFVGAGTREISNSLSLDGISVMNNLITNTPTRPMVETIQEVEVQTGTYSAQYGSYMGVHINEVTKAGTNSFHGAAVEFLRNQVLDARTFFTLPTPANPTASKPPLRQNQFGLEFDGPVAIPKLYNGKDKTFFMASYEGFRNVAQSTSLSTHMPAVFFTGNFSGVPTGSITGGAIKDPFNSNTPFPGNIIPTSRLSPITQKLQQYFPPTNLPGLTSNLSVPVPSTGRYNQTLDRLDQNIGDKVRLYARAHWQEWAGFGGSAIPVNATTTPTTVTNYTVGYTHTLTPNIVNDLRVGRNFFNTATVNPFSVNNQKTAGTDLGIPGFNGDSLYNNPGIPDFGITGFNGLGSGGTNWYQNDSTVQLSEQISWSHGSHNIMAGMEFRRLATGRAAVNSARGTFSFNGTQTGYAPADFVLGVPVSFATSGPEIRGRVATWRDGFFVLDKWQATRKLTLNYGIRYELPTVPYTINGVASILSPDQSTLQVATPGFKFVKPQHKLWAPRFGFAYRISDKTVFRGGAGIYYNPNQTNTYTFLNTNPPWSPIFQCNWSAGLPPIPLSNPFSVPAACPLPGSNSGALIVTPYFNLPPGRMNQWSASLDRQLWNGGGFELQYLGSHSYHLDRSFYNNTPLPGPGAVNSRRPNRNFGPIRTIANDEIANYESMSAIFRQRMSKGLQMQASYTWSHTIDVSTDSNGGGTPMNPYWWKADYGNSNWDVPHRLIAYFVYDIPFFANAHPVLKGALGAWQTNGTMILQSGLPFNVTTGTDTANTAASGSYRPNLVHAASADCGRGHLVGCIDATAFTVADLYPINPTNFAYGNAGRNILRGPGSQVVNLSVFKNFPIKECFKFSLRFEMFSILNRANFSNPSATINTGAFGNITGASGGRTIQIGSKLQF
ncbi:MAG: TonB-dependent receptor [Acidobacteria bacterium]|nr:TonB-dependent receptor [Acidobacteriota bacterium]